MRIEKPDYTLYIENGIIIGRYATGTILTAKIVRESYEDRMILSAGVWMPNLLDARGLLYATKEGKKEGSKEEYQQLLLATAILVNSHAMKIITNFFLTFIVRHMHPIKLFTDQQKALDWLEPYKSKNPTNLHLNVLI